MDKVSLGAVSKVVDSLVSCGARSAEKYISPNLVVRASRRLFRGKIIKGNIEIVLTIGRPNYAQRYFITDCKVAGEPLPVKKVILRFPPKSKNKRHK